MRIILTLIMFFSFFCSAGAQQLKEPVVKWADYTSYATAFADAGVSTILAYKSNDRKCNLIKLGIKEAIGNGSALVIKHFIPSPRPCIGCSNDGMPSEHTDNGFIGSDWRLGLAFGITTGVLRHTANRHTWKQVIAGAGVGIGTDLIGSLMKCSS